MSSPARIQWLLPGVPGEARHWGLAALAAFTGAAVAGYGFFGLHPELLPDSERARWIYRESFVLFARAQILVTAGVLALVLARRAGLAWIPGLLAVCAASFLAEHLGTGYGLPFGPYEYTGLLGPRILGRVPALIPLSWFAMAVPSYALARSRFGGPGGRSGRILLGAWLLACWDLALDPAMSHLTAYWRWAEPGTYYGMPGVNLAGWLLTGIVLMALLEVLGARRWSGRVPAAWWAGFYAVVLAMPLGMVAAAGLWPAVALTAGALALPFLGLRALAALRTRGAEVELPASEAA